MAWLSRVNFIASDTLSFTDVNNLGNDIRAWGDNVNGGGYTLSNVAISASSAFAPVVLGGTGTTSTLTLRATSGAGASGAAIVFQVGNNGGTEAARIINSGNLGVGATAPAQKLEVLGVTSLPATSGTTQNGLVRIASTATNSIDIGLSNASPFGAWIQTSNVTALGTTYPLLLNPNGGNVGIRTSSPATSATLEIAGTTGALLVPRLTTTERNALTAANGMIIYNTTDNQMQGRINGSWVAM
jgi:hypothetical protein